MMKLLQFLLCDLLPLVNPLKLAEKVGLLVRFLIGRLEREKKKRMREKGR